MNRTARLLGAAAALVVVVLGSIALLGRPATNVAAPPTPSPAPTSTVVAVPSTSAKLVTFRSTVYGYSIDIPEAWVARNALRVLAPAEPPLDTSDGVDKLSAAADRYGDTGGAPHGTIVIGSAAVARGTTLQQWTAGSQTAICGPTPPTSENFVLAGEAGSLLTFSSCNGQVYALWATALHGTSGWYVIWFNDPGTEAVDRALFEKILATFTFPAGVSASPTPS